ncbi:hypothetical protein JR316_0006697 [Psilocybe cubensis]|uniref:Uncharacterized protein n=2 Tax=Psilocybe cubensis TaxID=181762 RepID=A0A8H7XKY1_PSICU|nr:hypothetical protein JR316_0006697 [Psilocybe cubensis]KAH9480100.1 hypothetical protein JR316_0006697 [Psilocybe cubensis]
MIWNQNTYIALSTSILLIADTGRLNSRRYNIAIAILVESGLIYSCCLLTLILTFRHPNLRLLFSCITIRVVAIMPTLMIVQVQLGKSMDQVRSTRLNMEMKSTRAMPTATEVRLETIVVTANDDRRSMESESNDHTPSRISFATAEPTSETEENKLPEATSVKNCTNFWPMFGRCFANNFTFHDLWVTLRQTNFAKNRHSVTTTGSH